MQKPVLKILLMISVFYVIITLVYISNYQQTYSMFLPSKRTALLQKLAGNPQTASFSSATSLGAASMEGNHKRTVQLRDTVWGIGLTPSKFNGTWISDSDIMYKDEEGGISVLNMDTKTSYKVIDITQKKVTGKYYIINLFSLRV